MNNWLNKIQSLIYPYHCFLCAEAGHNGLDLCRLCYSSLTKLECACLQCGIALTSRQPYTCGTCLKSPPHFDKVHTLYHYQSNSRFLIQQLKFQRKFSAARTMGRLMARHFQDVEITADVIIPIPLHSKRTRQRGFNQSFEIAKAMQAELAIKIDHKLLKRTTNTVQQASLNAPQRKRNMQGAFQAGNLQHIERAVLIDDVITTGATASEAAKTLKKAGVKHVEVWAFARA